MKLTHSIYEHLIHHVVLDVALGMMTNYTLYQQNDTNRLNAIYNNTFKTENQIDSAS